jgi:replicative DNA helicase
VDYLQLIQGWGTPGQEAKAEITRQLKMLAKEIEATVIVLSQLNSGIEGRMSRAPQMSDLRDSGSIEQDCDIAIFPDVPQKSQDGTEGDQYESADLYLVKTRRGRTGVIRNLKWQGHYYRYSDNV